MRPQARRAVVLAAGRQRRAVERIDRGAVLAGECDVEVAVEPAFAADPEVGLPAVPKPAAGCLLSVWSALTSMIRLYPSGASAAP
jgi:hypothetical protein